jgi:flagellar biosynthesis protein FlhB
MHVVIVYDLSYTRYNKLKSLRMDLEKINQNHQK